MPRFSLTQLLMGTALIAILLVLTQTEGCGRRYTLIETISFSSDGSRIVATRLTARNARTPMKHYKSNVARTISWLDSATGASLGVIHQDYKPGNSGPAFQHWCVGRTSVICNPTDNRVAFSAFGGGDVIYGADRPSPKTVTLTTPAANLAISNSGRYLAASGSYGLNLIDTSTFRPVLSAQISDLVFLGALLMDFNNEDTRLVTVGDSGVLVWDTATGTQNAAVPVDADSSVHAIAVMPDDSLVICSDSSVKRYDLTGTLLNTISTNVGDVCAASGKTDTLAVSDGDTVTLYNTSNAATKRTLPISGVMSLAFSPNDKHLATGSYRGNVALYDLTTGNRLWSATPPGRHRWPWTIPVAVLCVWCWIAYWLADRANHKGKTNS